MSEYHFNLPYVDQDEHKVPPGTYKVTVSGITGNKFIAIDAWGGSDWVTLADVINPEKGGIIGGTTVTVPASGRIRMAVADTCKCTGSKVIFSRKDDITVAESMPPDPEAMGIHKLPPDTFTAPGTAPIGPPTANNGKGNPVPPSAPQANPPGAYVKGGKPSA
jgi:hypothetical protein